VPDGDNLVREALGSLQIVVNSRALVARTQASLALAVTKKPDCVLFRPSRGMHIANPSGEINLNMADVSGRVDSFAISRLHVIAGIACACAFGADVMEMTVGSALSAVFSQRPYQMDPQRLGWLISSVYIGAVIGGPALGWLADQRGVKRLLVAALLWVGSTSLLAASTNNVTLLLTFRLVSGLALGAIPPLILAYLSGIAPVRYRGLYMLWVCAISFLAAPAPIFLIRWLTPLQPFGIEGWRWPFIVAGLLAFGAALALLPFPESPRWLLKKNRHVQAVKVREWFDRSATVWGRKTGGTRTGASHQAAEAPALTAPFPPVNGPRARFSFAAVLFFLQPWSMTGFSILTGPILLARGYNLKDTLWFVGLANFGPAVSTLLAASVIDRLQRSTAIILASLLLLTAAAVFFTRPTEGWTTAAVVAFGIGSGFFIPLMGTYGAEIFINGAQASAISTVWAINRIGAVLVPITLLPLLHRGGTEPVALCIYLALGLSILLVGFLGPRAPAASLTR
jgi:MFS transporter, putative metabolite:H+ symporter